MRIIVNGSIIESEDASLCIEAAIVSFARIGPDGKQISPDVEVIRAWALDFLNQWRGEQRAATGLTSAAFQELVYTGKALEASRWLNDKESKFVLSLEAQTRGLTNEEMAWLVMQKWLAWQEKSDQIEAAYIGARIVVEAAQDVEEIKQALRFVAWRLTD